MFQRLGTNELTSVKSAFLGQCASTCSKSDTKTEVWKWSNGLKRVNVVQNLLKVNNKDTRATLIDIALVSLLLTLIKFSPTFRTLI